LSSLRVERPGRTVLGIGRKGQLTNVDKRKLRQNGSNQIRKQQHHKGPGQRQDPVGLSPRHNNPCFQNAQTTDQPELSETDSERDRHYHTHKNRKKRMLCAAALLVLWTLSPTPTVFPDCSYTQMPCTTSVITYSNVSPRGATSYGCLPT